jgi:glycosyltransferase involved in cell wall biosynthesis
MTIAKSGWTDTIRNVFLGRIESKRRAKKETFDLSIITQFYPPDYAATGQLIQELANELTKQGMNIHVFTGQPGYAFEKATAPVFEYSENLLVKRSRASRLWGSRVRGKAINGVFFCLRSVIHLLKSGWRGKTLLLTTAPPFLPAIGYLMNLCFGQPYVCLIYDLYPEAVFELKVLPAHHWIIKLWDRFNRHIWGKARQIIVLSSTMKDRIVTKHPQIEAKIAVIHSWADTDSIKPIPKENNWFARQYNLVDKFTVFYSGNIGRCHDVITIMEAARLLRNEPIQFIFIGSGAKKPTCKRIAGIRALHNCLFLPFQDKKDLPYTLTSGNLALVSIAPGLEGVVVPSKLYGVLAAGLPVAAICEPHSYLRQLIADAGCGATFENGDAIALANFIHHLSVNPDQTARMGIASRRYCETHFTPEIIAKEYAEVVKSGESQELGVRSRYKR